LGHPVLHLYIMETVDNPFTLTAEYARAFTLMAEGARAFTHTAEDARAFTLMAEDARAFTLTAEGTRAFTFMAEDARAFTLTAEEARAFTLMAEDARAFTLTAEEARAFPEGKSKADLSRIDKEVKNFIKLDLVPTIKFTRMTHPNDTGCRYVKVYAWTDTHLAILRKYANAAGYSVLFDDMTRLFVVSWAEP